MAKKSSLIKDVVDPKAPPVPADLQKQWLADPRVQAMLAKLTPLDVNQDFGTRQTEVSRAVLSLPDPPKPPKGYQIGLDGSLVKTTAQTGGFSKTHLAEGIALGAGVLALPFILPAVLGGAAGGGAASGAAGGGGAGSAGAAAVGGFPWGKAITAGLAIGGAAVNAVGQLKAGADQKQADEYNASVEDALAQDALTRGQLDEQKLRMQIRGTIGKQRAGFAGQGVDVGVGSAVDVQADAGYLGELDAQTVRANAAREAFGHTVNATNFRNAGDVAQTTSRFGALNTAVGTATSLLASRYGWGK